MKKNEALTLQVSRNARKLCVEKNVIKEGQLSLSKEDLINIVMLFGGQLEFVKDTDFYEKVSEREYKIYCDEEKEDYTLNVLAGLGRAFFDQKNMIDGQKVGIEKLDSEKDYDYKRCDISKLFAREFLMPRENFEKVLIKYMDDDKVNVTEVAKTYNIGVFPVLERGSELHILK